MGEDKLTWLNGHEFSTEEIGEIILLGVRTGKIQAIKRVRELSGSELRESKKFIEQFVGNNADKIQYLEKQTAELHKRVMEVADDNSLLEQRNNALFNEVNGLKDELENACNDIRANVIRAGIMRRMIEAAIE